MNLLISSFILSCQFTTRAAAFVTTTPNFINTISKTINPSNYELILESKPVTKTSTFSSEKLFRSRRSFLRYIALSSTKTTDEPEYTEHAREIFSLIDTDQSGTICAEELDKVLSALDIPATEEEVMALFKYLDSDGSGDIDFDDEFAPWYQNIIEETGATKSAIRGAIAGRKTVYEFDKTRVSDDVLERAVECALSAPKLNEMSKTPWRFVNLGSESIRKAVYLIEKDGSDLLFGKDKKVAPGWCVVTCRKCLLGRDHASEEDFATTCCAIENFMLSMYAEGVGTRWISQDFIKTKEFGELCSVDLEQEIIVACILFGFASGGLSNINELKNNDTVEDVLSYLK